MYPVSIHYENHIKRPTRIFNAKVSIRGIEYSDENIVEMVLDETVNPSDTFVLGSAASSKLDLTLIDTENTTVEAVENAVIKPFIGLEVNGVIEYVPLGVFYAESVEKNKGKLSITSFDAMVKFEKPYVSNLVYPTSLRNVANEISSSAGITLANPTDIPTIQVNKLEGYSLRQAISFVASFVGGFARFNRDGNLEITPYQSTYETITADNYIELKTAENECELGKLTCKVPGGGEDGEDIELTSGTGTTEIHFENPLMTQTQLNSIYDQLKILSYLPYDMKWQGNPALQAGDKIQIIDENNRVFNTLLMEQQLKYNGGVSATARAKGKTETAQEFNREGSISQRIERQDERIANNKKEIERKAEEIISDLNQRTGNINASIENLRDRTSDVEGNVANINQEINEIEGRLSTTITQLSNIDGVVSEHSLTLEALPGQLNAKAEKSEVYTRTEIDDQLGNKVDTAIYNNKMTELDLSIRGISGKVSNIEATVDEVSGDMSSALSQIANLDIQANQIILDVSEIQNDLNGRISEVEANITTLSGQINLKADSTIVDGIDTRLNSAEIRIDGLQSEIELKVDADGVIAAINLSTDKIEGSKIDLIGAVTVLSDITGNLGSITAGELFGTYIESAHIVNGNVDIQNDIIKISSDDQWRWMEFKDSSLIFNVYQTREDAPNNIFRIYPYYYYSQDRLMNGMNISFYNLMGNLDFETYYEGEISFRTGRFLSDSKLVLKEDGKALFDYDVTFNGLPFYEEGDWTPIIDSTQDSRPHTYNVRTGKYIRRGDLVTVFFDIAMNVKSSGATGGLYIRGLPFPPATDVNFASNIAYIDNVELPTNRQWLTMYRTGYYIGFRANGNNVPSVQLNIQDHWKSNSSIRGTATYRINQ